MLKIKKIEDKSINMDVQGQGCWDDCYFPGYWEAMTSYPSCNYISAYYTVYISPLM